MGRAFIFYNPLAGEGRVLEDLEALEFVLDTACVLCDMTKPETYGEALFSMDEEDYLVLCGGDGTVNRFVNLTAEVTIPCQILYYPAGIHNDFARDLGLRYGNNPVPITNYLHSLPRATVGGKTMRFLTGAIFYPADGSGRKKTFSSLGLTADGETHTFRQARLAAVMFGRHAFGGMRPVPEQNRAEEMLTVMVLRGCSRFYEKWLLRKLRRGKPLPRSKKIVLLRARELTLAFAEAADALADGEPMRQIQSCHVSRGKETL